MRLKLSQPSLAGVGAGAELGNRRGIVKESQIDLSVTEGGREVGREGICGVLRCLRT